MYPFERACHALAFVVHYVGNAADGDALTPLYLDVAVDRNAWRAWCYLRGLGIEDPQGKALQVLRTWFRGWCTVKYSIPPPSSVVWT